MWQRLVRFFKGEQRPVVSSIPNELLGMLVFSEDDECWVTSESASSLPFRFFIAGNWDERLTEIAPDHHLIEHAESIAREPTKFLEDVADFVRTELKSQRRLKGLAEEVAQLKVSAVNLSWAERPNDGMIQFTGPNDNLRLWRCDYLNRKPVGPLGFDS
jgi:hypothetical protein